VQERTPVTDKHASLVEKINEQMVEGQPEEVKPITAIPWFFIIAGVVAVVLMVLFLINNR